VPVDAHNQDVYESAYYVAMRMLVDAIGIELDEVRYHREVATTDHAFDIAAGTIDAGTVAAMKFVFDGIVDDRTVVSLQAVWRVSDDVAPDWPVGDSRWLLHIDGDPVVDSEFTMSTEEDAGRAVSLSVATLCLNAVPTVVASAPGLLDNLTLPVHAGGYVDRRVPASS
jgi:2,4-diaminopentanoate dehydrogenase